MEQTNGLPRSKIALVHLAFSQLKLDDDDRRAIMSRVAGVTSSKDLDEAGFVAVMDELATLGFQSTARRAAAFGSVLGRPDYATPGQVAKIRVLWSEVTDGQGDDGSLDKWLEGKFRVSALRFVQAHLVGKIIGALEGWKRGKARRRAKSAP